MPPAARFERLAAAQLPDASTLSIEINGRQHAVDARWTVAAALVAHGYAYCRCDSTGRKQAPYCLAGVCFACLVDIDGVSDCQACLTPVRAGMRVRCGGSGAEA
jgi:predicted molibdopterin-dependent oxidoreductase YjgC